MYYVENFVFVNINKESESYLNMVKGQNLVFSLELCRLLLEIYSSFTEKKYNYLLH